MRLLLKSLGLNVTHIQDKDIKSNLEGVMWQLNKYYGLLTHPSTGEEFENYGKKHKKPPRHLLTV